MEYVTTSYIKYFVQAYENAFRPRLGAENSSESSSDKLLKSILRLNYE